MDDEFWYCLKHHQVEGREGCKASDRLGPYRTAEEASRALDKVAERNDEWDNDPVWNPGKGQGEDAEDAG